MPSLCEQIHDYLSSSKGIANTKDSATLEEGVPDLLKEYNELVQMGLIQKKGYSLTSVEETPVTLFNSCSASGIK